MPEIKDISIYTKAFVETGNTGQVGVYYNDEESEIYEANILGVDPTGNQIEANFFSTSTGNGIIIANKDDIPENLEIVLEDNGNLVLIGDNADKYSIDQNTGHLIYTEP